MARPTSLAKLTSDQIYSVWQKAVEKEEQLKLTLLKEAKATVKELEAWFAGKKGRKTKGKVGRPAGKKANVTKPKSKKMKRGGLKKSVLALLAKGPQPISVIVKETGGKYPSVAQTVNNLVKGKVAKKEAKRGGAYSLVK